MNDTHFKSAQNLFFLKDTVEILSIPPSIFLGTVEVNCPQSRGKVLCLLSIEILSGMGSRLHRCQFSVLGD